MQQPSFLLPREQYSVLANALGETVENTIAVHHLQRGLGRAYVYGDPREFKGAIIQPEGNLSRELMGFGEENALFALLQSVTDWDCVNLEPDTAQRVGKLFEDEGAVVRYYNEQHYVLHQSVIVREHPTVRLLTMQDLSLLQSASPEVQGDGFGSLEALLQDGFVAAGIINGQIVAIAHTSARTTSYADIAITTLEAYRNHGMSTAAASLVAQKIQEAELTPVWSTGHDNYASQRVAEKLGFTFESKRVYVIPQR